MIRPPAPAVRARAARPASRPSALRLRRAPMALSPRLLVLPALAALLALGACDMQQPAAGDPPAVPPPPGATFSVVEGEDYRLPAGTTATPFSGYINHSDPADPERGLSQKGWWARWEQLEPQRGQYDWSALDAALASAAAGGHRLSIHLQSIVCGGGSPERGIVVPNVVPAWVFDEFGLTEADLINLGWEFDLKVIPAWRPEIRDAFNDLVRALGERGYPQDERLGSCYIHGISPSRGEEFWLENTNIYTLEQQGGFSADALETWMRSRLEAYAAAFAGVEHKLAWVGVLDSWRYRPAAYTAVADRLFRNAWDLGIGTRHGAVEYYHRLISEPALGQQVDADGYLIVDETIPPIATARYFGDENEEYGDAWTWRFGDRAGEPQRYRFSMLRALQMRLRFLYTSSAAEAVDPPLSTYARLSFGKGVHDSPDAWAYLKESPAGTHYSPAGVLRNFERWLIQRDVPGGMTTPTERVDRAFNAGALDASQTSLYYDHVARRTGIDGGNPCIYFDLDDRFLTSGPVEIKVEIRDDSRAMWRLEYRDGAGAPAATPLVRNQNDGKVKTVTFTLPNAAFRNGMDHDMDFRVRCEGPGDVTVRWVRLIRNLAP